jgi:hypothetical protein
MIPGSFPMLVTAATRKNNQYLQRIIHVNIKLDQFEFFISVLSEFGVVIPSQFDVQDQKMVLGQ